MNSLDIVSKATQRDELTHAYLVPVRSGTNLESYAAELGQIILCSPENKDCPEKVVRDTHPDFIRINVLNDNSQISINQVEDIISGSSYSPVEAKRKLYVINRAEDLSLEAANSLLKILEDPPDFVYFLLLTESPNSLLPTIISRCQQLPRGGTSVEGMKDLLSGKGYEEAEIDYLVEVVNRKATLLDDLLEEGVDDPLGKKEKIREEFKDFDLVDLTSEIVSRDSLLKKAVFTGLLFERIEGASNFQLLESAEKLAQLNREDLEWFLEKGLYIYRNDYKEEITEGTNPDDSLGEVKIFDRALFSLSGNANVQLLLESLLLNLGGRI